MTNCTSQPWLGFYGAAESVTGSRTILTHCARRYLVDCGLFQGTQEERARNWQPFPFDPTAVEAVLLTHAHVDHCGALPLLVRAGFKGPIVCSGATAELLPIMLRDTAKLQEEEAAFRNRRGWSKHRPALPLFTQSDVDRVLTQVEPIEYGQLRRFEGVSFTLHKAEHIVGSAHVLAQLDEGPRVLFSGDLGRPDSLLFGSIPERPAADVIVCESTYGDRRHPAIAPLDELCAALQPVLARSGVALLPAFAIGRTHELMAAIEQLMISGRLPRCPVHLDSPMAQEALRLTRRWHEELAPTGFALCEAACRHAQLVHDVAQSKALNTLTGPAIIIAGSGMLNGGRILHHVMARAANTNDALILTGFQARGTRGRRLVEGERVVKIFGQPTELRLEVEVLSSFSAHADQTGILNWLAQGPVPQKIYLNHGDAGAVSALAIAVRARLGPGVFVRPARLGEHFAVV